MTGFLDTGFAASGSGYQIDNSLRFRASASAFLSRTFGAGNSKTWTWSGWVKRGKFGSPSNTLFVNNGDAYITFTTADTLEINIRPASTNYRIITTQVFRDPTAWLHIVCVCDTANATADDRLKLFINGVQVTAFGTRENPTLDLEGGINAAVAHSIGKYSTSSNYLDGYLSNIHFIDGQALDPSSFGETNSDGVWVPKDYSGTYGNNGFYLPFDDATSLTTLGEDRSGNANNWTCNNISLTAGVTYDHMVDTPTDNYATLNPLDAVLNSGTLSNANLYLQSVASGSAAGAPPTIKEMQGKLYLEPHSISNGGFGRAVVVVATYPTYSALAVVSFGTGGTVTSYGTGGVAVDFDTGKVWVRNTSGTWISGDPEAGTSPTATFTPGTGITIYLQADRSPSQSPGGMAHFNFGQRPFAYTPPTGFKALSTASLPAVAIPNPPVAIAHRWEAGSGIAAAIAGDRSGWADWIEVFKRTDATGSWLVRLSDDSSNMLSFDTSAAKTAWAAPSANTFLGLALRVGAAYGCVTGTYSVDNTSNRNISHSMGNPPTCGIVKNESTGSWYVWHSQMTSAAHFTTLNSATPPAQSNTNTPWGTGNWSSTEFMVTNNGTNNLNATGSTYRYILFRDISGLLEMLGHTGNAAADGAFAWHGHRPQLAIEKNLAATTGFFVFSDKIDPHNVTASYLLLNTNAAITAATGVDLVSNGVKHRSTTIGNAANAYMTISYARHPFGGENVAPATAR